MTDTTELAAAPPAPPGRPSAADVEVEVWGPPGSGKTVLLASLFEAFDRLRDMDALATSPAVRDVHRRLLEDQGSPITRPAGGRRPAEGMPGEQMSVTLHPSGSGGHGPGGRRVRVVSYGGADLTAGPALDAAAWAAGRAGKVVVVCLNPFLLDAELAWKGLRHLVAVLQGPGLGYPFERAMTEAAHALLHVEPEALLHRPNLRNLLPFLGGATLAYDAAQPDPDLRFDWGRTDPSLRQQLTDELRRLVHEQVRLAAPPVNVVRRGLRQLNHAVVVLTHVDWVEAVLPSVTFADLERVFDDVFAARPDRRADQQVLARLFHIEVSNVFAAPPTNGDGEGPRPPTTGVLTGRLRTDGAAAVVRYIQSVVASGTADETVTSVPSDRPAGAWDGDARLAAAEQRAADAAAELDRERHARQQFEATAAILRAEVEQLAEQARAREAKPAPTVIPAGKPTVPTDPVLPAPGDATAELRAELDAARRRFEELRSRTQEEIGRRDETIGSLGEQVRARDIQVAEERNLRRTAEKGGLGEAEAREREAYEAGRAGPGRLWAALLARSLPAVPACALVAAAAVRATTAHVTFGHAFVIASGVGLPTLAAALGVGVYLYWGDVGPRWVWFRSRNDKAGLFDVLTSAGERVQAPPREFTLEASPILELLGLGVVRRGGNGLTYATTEPDAWRAHLDPTQVRRRWLTDAVTVAAVLAWAAALIALAG